MIQHNYTVGAVYYYRDLGTNHNCPYYQGVLLFQVNVYNKAPFGAIIKFMDYAGVIFKYPD